MSTFDTKGNRPINVVGIGGTMREFSSSLLGLKRALHAAEEAGATTQLLDLRTAGLPLYDPAVSLADHGPSVSHFISSTRQADVLILSTAAYHGTLAGITKNAIDFFQLLAGGDRPYLHQKVVGLVATAGGDMAAVNAINAMVHSVHSLRGTLVPLTVTIPQAWKGMNAQEGYIDPKWAERLDSLGRLVVTTAAAFVDAERPVPA